MNSTSPSISTARSASVVGASTFEVRVSRLIEAEYIRRDVFPQIRREHAALSLPSGQMVYIDVAADVVREMHKDAEHHRYGRKVPPSQARAYGCLANRLRLAVRAAQAPPAEPPVNLLPVDVQLAFTAQRFLAGFAPTPARLIEGVSALYFADGDEYGEEVTVCGGFNFWEVADHDGPYVDANGRPFTYRFGYLIKRRAGGKQFFSAAHQLTLADCRPAHLKLV